MTEVPYLFDRITVTETCWLWTGPKYHNGYGQARGGRVHRLMYEALVGPIPDGLELDHLCRIRECVNPEHLEPVTRAENARRARTRGEAIGRPCKRCGVDSWFRKRNSWNCAECERIRERNRSRRKRQK